MTWNPLRRARQRREQRAMDIDRWRVARRLADEDVTVLGQQLATLDTAGREALRGESAHHHRRALVHYEQAKAAVLSATTTQDLCGVEEIVASARYHRAAVLALQAGEPVPLRREPCFFDPRHGPSTQDVRWAPALGAVRTVAVCAADARRLGDDEPPLVRMVLVGARYVPSHEAGGVEAVLERHRGLHHERSMSHNRRSVAEAHLNQAINGVHGPGGPFG